MLYGISLIAYSIYLIIKSDLYLHKGKAYLGLSGHLNSFLTRIFFGKEDAKKYEDNILTSENQTSIAKGSAYIGIFGIFLGVFMILGSLGIIE